MTILAKFGGFWRSCRYFNGFVLVNPALSRRRRRISLPPPPSCHILELQRQVTSPLARLSCFLDLLADAELSDLLSAARGQSPAVLLDFQETKLLHKKLISAFDLPSSISLRNLRFTTTQTASLSAHFFLHLQPQSLSRRSTPGISPSSILLGPP